MKYIISSLIIGLATAVKSICNTALTSDRTTKNGTIKG